MKYPAYPEYRDSGVEWLGCIPEHWEVKRLKTLASMRSGDSITGLSIEETGDYPVYGGNGVRGFASEYTHSGEFVLIGRQGALCGNVHLARGKFWASEHAVVASLRNANDIRWYANLLEIMNLNQYSMTAAQPGLSVDQIQSLPVVVPSGQEQSAIAEFLDVQTARIDSLVRKKLELVEKLKEKRTALISRMVTRGLDPNVPLEPSGIEWLGDVPEHWDVKRLKFLLKVGLQYGANETAELDDPDLPRYVRITDVDESGNLREETFRSLPREIACPYLLTDGDLLFARSGATVGKTFLYKESWGVCAYAGYLIRARIDRRRALPPYLKYFTVSALYSQWTASVLCQATIQNVSADKYASLWLTVPPVCEQAAIADYLDRETAKIDSMIAKVEQAIEKLQEYRTALITAAVTGKIDVREVPV